MSSLIQIINETSKLYHKLQDSKISDDEFDDIQMKLNNLTQVSNLDYEDTSDLQSLTSMRFHILDTINLIIFMRYQGKINKEINNLVKSLGADVSEIDKYLKDQENYGENGLNNFGIF